MPSIHFIKSNILALVLVLAFGQTMGQGASGSAPEGRVYRRALKLDIPLAVGGVGVAVAGLLTERKLTGLTMVELNLLDRSSIGGFNRGAAYNWSPETAKISDVMLFSSILAPVGMTVVPTRSRERLSIGLMAAEALFLTYGLTSGTKGTARKIRPFAYNSSVPQETRMHPDARASFPSGHASHVALACFFTAKVYSDLYPERLSKYFVWGGAAAFSGTVAWLRVRAGKHFPTDVLAGTALGAGIGVLIPHLHKKERKYFTIAPLPGGLQLAWRF